MLSNGYLNDVKNDKRMCGSCGKTFARLIACPDLGPGHSSLITIRKEFMSTTVPAHCLDFSSHVNTRPPRIKIEGCKLEEDGSEDPGGILPEFQGGDKGESTAGVGGSGSEIFVKEEDVVQHELLVCQPCDEDEDVGNNSMTDDESWDGDGNGGENDDDEFEPGYEKKSQYGISTIWHTCPQEGCQYMAKRREHIKTHLAHAHDIGVTWHTCPQEGCEYKAKQKGDIKQHLAHIHDVGVTWHACPQEGCQYKAKRRDTIKTHLANIHNIGVTWHACPQEGCQYKAKRRNNIKQHLASIHDIGVTWHPCPQEGCEYKTKRRGNLKDHLANIHSFDSS